MNTPTRVKRTPNHSAWRFVDKREPFDGNHLIGRVYPLDGTRPFLPRKAWTNGYESEQWFRHLDKITYVVWSWNTPIGYYVEDFGWYVVGQTFSSFTSRHVNGALRNVVRHGVRIEGKRGDWRVTCDKCGTVRCYTWESEARRDSANH